MFNRNIDYWHLKKLFCMKKSSFDAYSDKKTIKKIKKQFF
ncbi:hypothetical protein FEDK69T_16730 [Flavobacterium enshiense DK69]|nr:hypothetical protein FEDK69T_16730 [Flavobacterium enshiense DK69]